MAINSLGTTMDGGQVNSLGVKDLVPKVLVADLFVFGGLYTSSSVSLPPPFP